MLVVEVLDGKKHDRKNFECDSEDLNLYLKERASQVLEKDIARLT